MTDADRANILQTLGSRHEELLAGLDSLEKQVESALAATRPPAPAEVAGICGTNAT